MSPFLYVWNGTDKSEALGKTLGNTKRNCKFYRREIEFYSNIEKNDNFDPKDSGIDNLLKLKGFDKHYKSLYQLHNREVIDFFKSKNPHALFYSDLYDKKNGMNWENLSALRFRWILQCIRVNLNKFE